MIQNPPIVKFPNKKSFYEEPLIHSSVQNLMLQRQPRESPRLKDTSEWKEEKCLEICNQIKVDFLREKESSKEEESNILFAVQFATNLHLNLSIIGCHWLMKETYSSFRLEIFTWFFEFLVFMKIEYASVRI